MTSYIWTKEQLFEMTWSLGQNVVMCLIVALGYLLKMVWRTVRDIFQKFSERKQPTTLVLQNSCSNMFHQTSGFLWSFLYLLKLQTGSQQACSQMFRHWKILIFDFFFKSFKIFLNGCFRYYKLLLIYKISCST